MTNGSKPKPFLLMIEGFLFKISAWKLTAAKIPTSPAGIANDAFMRNGLFVPIVKKRHEKAFFGLCLFCLAGLFLYLSPNKEKRLIEKIHQIPLKDRWAIESFFEILLFEDAGAYVFFGDKPAAFTAYFDFNHQELSSPFFRKYHQENRRLRKGWETWEKYQHLFPSDFFVLQARYEEDRSWTEIMLINRQNFTRILQENKEFAPQDLLLNYEKGKLSLFNHLKRNHASLGIVLGFGKRNSILFQQRDRTFEDPYQFTLHVNPRPSFEFNTVEEERAFYNKILKPAFEDWKKCYKLIYLPIFLADLDSPETKELQKKYLNQRREIHDIYSHGNFLETTLKKFCLNK